VSRNRRERREEREPTRYQMRQRMISIGDDYENDVLILAIVAVIGTMAHPDR
jgi:hypothetical protein